MKMRMTICALVLAASAALSGVAQASCDVRQMYTDKQAKCAADCDDQYIRDKQHSEAAIIARAQENKKACDAACGCAQNSN